MTETVTDSRWPLSDQGGEPQLLIEEPVIVAALAGEVPALAEIGRAARDALGEHDWTPDQILDIADRLLDTAPAHLAPRP